MMAAAGQLQTVEAIASTRLPLNEAIFGWCLRNAQRGLARNALETALRWSRLAAKSAVHHGFGRLGSPELENTLLAVASRLPHPEPVPGAGSPPVRWLHVMDQAHAIGGHSALVHRWMEINPRGGRHSVLLLSHRGSVDPRLVEETRATGGAVGALSADAPLMERAIRLREEAWKHADRVVLHVHPWSVIPVVALGAPGGPPVMLLNHLSQKFWVGGSVADLVLNLRDSALEWSQTYRGITRNALLPIPILPRVGDRAKPATNETRRAARSTLGMPPEAIVLLTIGNAYKYRPLPGLDFLDAVAAILHACPQAYVVAVGPRPDARWMALRESTGQRLLAAGPQLDLARFHEAADVYLEGFPVGSPTALLEVGLLGIPCVRAPRNVPPPFAVDGIALSGVRQPVDVADYVRAAIALVRNEGERRVLGSALAGAIQAHHTEPGWPDYAQNAESALPERHRVYSLAGAAPLPTHLRDLSVALSTLGHAEDTLTFTFRAAFELGLPVRLDAALAKALVTRCLVGDPRLLRRRWLLVALVESVTGHGLMKGIRRARQRRAREVGSAKV
jgi:hypothetical protein